MSKYEIQERTFKNSYRKSGWETIYVLVDVENNRDVNVGSYQKVLEMKMIRERNECRE